MKTPHLLLLLVCGLSFAAMAQSKPVRSVAECYLALPDRFAGDASRKVRERALDKAEKGGGSSVDLKNGYLQLEIPPMTNVSVALFPAKAGEPVLGIVHKVLAGADQPRFYQLINGDWQEVTEKVLPKGTYPKFGFELPRKGTSLSVYEQYRGLDGFELTGKEKFVAKWNGERFVRGN